MNAIASSKKLIKKALTNIGVDVKRVQAPLTTLDLYTRLYGEESTRNRRFYNIGAGAFRHDAWTNVDKPSDHYQFFWKDNNPSLVPHDMESMEELPIPSNSAELAYTSHCMEHITTKAAQRLFQDVHRFLKKGGIFRVTVPDLDLFIQAYKAQDRDFFYWLRPFESPEEYAKLCMTRPPLTAAISQLLIFEVASAASELFSEGSHKRVSDKEFDDMFREKGPEATLDYCSAQVPPEVQEKHPWCHRNWWNKEKLIKNLKQAGFGNVYVSAYGQSMAPPLRDTAYFDCTQPPVSLYVEAAK